jgi:hypothetical protein
LEKNNKLLDSDSRGSPLLYLPLKKLLDSASNQNFCTLMEEFPKLTVNLQSQKAPYVVLLSGTPALSRPGKCCFHIYLDLLSRSFSDVEWVLILFLYIQLQALYPTVYKNVNEYGNRYCRGVSTRFIEFFCSLCVGNYDLFLLGSFSGFLWVVPRC